MNSIYKTQEEIQQSSKLQHYILQTFGLQSKKKRVRKKMLKQVVSQESLLMKVVTEFHQEEQEMENLSSAISFTTLPVTTLLKIGKEFFKENDSVRYYYNKNKLEQYKNKDLLVKSITKNYQTASTETKKKIEQFI